ncbi:ATP-binding cassette domain-containing protein, partial [Salmonella enterica]
RQPGLRQRLRETRAVAGVEEVQVLPRRQAGFNPRLVPYPQQAAMEAVAHAAQAGLAGFEDVPVARLSAGQQRRVALARLWLTRAALWVLDEPFTAIDVNGVARLTRRMAAHTAQGGMVILTTHQPLPGAADTVRRLALTGGGAGL